MSKNGHYGDGEKRNVVGNASIRCHGNLGSSEDRRWPIRSSKSNISKILSSSKVEDLLGVTPLQGQAGVRHDLRKGQLCESECDLGFCEKRHLYFPYVKAEKRARNIFKRKKRFSSSSVFFEGDEAEREDHFDKLPDEIVLQILKNLPKSSYFKITQVSKRFGRLIKDESLWSKIDVKSRTLDAGHLDTILSRKPTYLRMAGCFVKPNQTLESLNTNLKYLDLSSVQIFQPLLFKFLKNCPNLEKLSLEHVNLEGCDFLGFSGNIDTLNLSMCYGLGAGELGAWLGALRGLKRLNLGCIKTNWSEKDLQDVIQTLPASLEELNLAGFRSTMKDDHISSLTRRCSSLLHLDISDCQELTGKSLTEIIENLEKLENLGLSRCYSIEAQTFTHLAHLKSLKFLQLFTVFKETSVKTLAATLPKVKLNSVPFSSVARPTCGASRNSMWGVRDF